MLKGIQQYIPCSQISVHKIALFQIFHSLQTPDEPALKDAFILDMPESQYVINDSNRSPFPEQPTMLLTQREYEPTYFLFF